MSDSTVNKRKWIEKLQDSFKVVILDEEDYREINSFSLSRKGFYLLGLTLLFIISSIIVSLIVFTPIKSLIPGYGKLENDKAYMTLFNKIEDLESKLKAQEVYTVGLQNMLQGIENGAIKSGTEDDLNLPPINSRDIKETVNAASLAQYFLTAPLSGAISKGYDPSIEHYGVDILAPKQTPVKTIQDGVVINAEWTEDSGHMVTIQHSHNIVSVYKHNSSLLVKSGQRVETGQAIAIIGNTGTLSSGPHLHFELWYEGIPVNPINFITF